jgi:hypothetical protein
MLEWTAGGEHPFSFRVKQPRWPPFYATAFFLPRINLSIENTGEPLPKASIGLYVGAYDGRIGDIPSAEIDWVDTEHQQVESEWKTDETKRLRFTVRSRNLPHAGTYVLKFLLTEFLPLGIPYEEAIAALGEAGVVPRETRDAILRSSREMWEQMGIDPHEEQRGGFKGRGIHTIYVVDYFRVEPISSVLTFGLVAVTLLLALATLGLIIATLTR